MRVATLCGSLHSSSTNAVLVSAVAARLAEAGVTVEPIDTSVHVPAFSPEQVDDPPATVRTIRDAIARADGLIVSVPEYAGGLPGWVKNITDWMVGAAALYERPVAVLSAATLGGAHAIEQLARTMVWQGAFVVATCSVAAPLTMIRDNALTDADALRHLHHVGDLLVEVMRGERDASDAAAAALVPLGIDPVERLA